MGAGEPSGGCMDGVRVVESETAMGRVVVATRGFETGEVVLAEPAALVWLKEGGPTGLLRAFSRAKRDTQEAVLEMFHPALKSEAAGAVLERSYQVLLPDQQEELVSLEDTQRLMPRLMLIATFNAHFFLGRTNPTVPAAPDAPAEASLALGVEPFAKHSALFVIGSKVEHSCLPNVSYGSKTGQLVYKTVRPIAAGDRISFAYVATTQQDTQERRELLVASKLFICACARCEGPDVCRSLPCSACSGGITLRTSPAESMRSSDGNLVSQLWHGVGATWTCLSCNTLATDAEMSAAIKKEAQLVADLEQRKAISSVKPGMVRAALQQQILLHSALPPMHHLHARYSELVSFLTASEANTLKGCPPSMVATMVRAGTMQPIKQLQWEAAVSAVKLIVWRERSKAVLLGRMQPQATWEPGAAASKQGLSPQARLAHIVGSVWSGSHEAAALKPCWDSARDAYYAGIDLEHTGSAAEAAPIFRRYRGVIFSWLQADDHGRRRRVQEVLDRFP
ncbi:hypothetical protein FOA52_011309 [Chlamydomonas sp. UWO 241]|nr:hypothetical protein FOA52_011309 [Chlamydomonas sp. UWO 241]